MSLQVWLPLTRDLRQQGLSTGSITCNNASFDTNGKLGGCYVFSGVDNAIGVGNLSTMTTTDFTFTCWFYHDDTWSSKGWETIFGGPSGFELQAKNSTTNSPVIYLYSWGKGNFAYELNKWNHLAMVRTASETKVYLNGELKITGSTGSIPNGNYFVGSWRDATSQNFKGKMCDVRIYDNALSSQEVKEISKGLILHYPLSDAAIESTANLITTEDCLSATCYNGATGKYSYGTTTDMYKIVTTFEGRKGTKVYMGTNGGGAFPYVYIGNLYTSNGGSYPLDRTLSFDYYSTISTSIRPYKLGSGSGTATYRVHNAATGISTGTGTDAVMIPVQPNMWNYVEITFHGTTTDAAQWGYIQNYPSHTSDTSNFWFFANMQLENKDHATAYAGVGGTRTSTTIYDTSGYCNNGTITGDLIFSEDTPKYSASTKFSGSEKITTTSLPSEVQSVSFWVKVSTIPSGYGICYVDSGTQTSIGFYNGNSFITSCTVSANVVLLGTTFKANEWNHIVLVKTGTNTRNVYCNGVLLTSSGTNSWVHNGGNLSLGWRDYASGNAGWFNGQLCDFRAYATALSADDVLSLYQNEAAFDENGNILGPIR